MGTFELKTLEHWDSYIGTNESSRGFFWNFGEFWRLDQSLEGLKERKEGSFEDQHWRRRSRATTSSKLLSLISLFHGFIMDLYF